MAEQGGGAKQKKLEGIFRLLGSLDLLTRTIIILAVISFLLALIEGHLCRHAHAIAIISEDGFYWFFSALAQSMSALLGLGAVFAVYYVQAINGIKRERIRQTEIDLGFGGLGFSTARALLEINCWAGKNPEGMSDYDRAKVQLAKTIESTINTLGQLKEALLKQFFSVAIIMTASILLSLFALPFSPVICSRYSGNSFILIMTVLTAIALVQMIRFILFFIRALKE